MFVSELGAGHACAVHRTEEEQREVSAAFVAGGLSRGDKIVVLDGPSCLAGVFDRMTEDGHPPGRWERPGALEVLNRSETWRLVGSGSGASSEIDVLMGDAVRQGWTQIRLLAVLPAALRRDAGPASVEFDRAVEFAARTWPLSALCQFDAGAGAGDAHLEQLRRQHDVLVEAPALFDDGQLRITRTPGGLRLAGEADLRNRRELAAVLEEAVAGAHGAPEVDIASLRFVDAACLRLLASAATIRNPSPDVARLLALLGSEPDGAAS
ncbi:MEDS domain-containing protein [Pseudonocardia nigra]|uniref:MEDS domain-containing protein n=1 Tax=Pseudonocardia nigra TaxID=1921578 RepID=UPI001C5F8336|nr:MEDS domain-containing protein [Pseudonocardia nigra]